MPSKCETRWAIFAGPQQFKAPGTRYIAWDGTVTDLKYKAANFFSYDEAKAFAEKQGIDITKATRYIGQEDFTEFEIQMNERRI